MRGRIAAGALGVLVVLSGLLVAPAAAASPIVARASFPEIDASDRGTDVVLLQLLLRSHAGRYRIVRGLEPTGAIDTPTRLALLLFQRTHGLRPDARMDARTWTALAPEIGRGDSGPAVEALQLAIHRKLGWDVPLDGSFGSATERVVRRFQKEVGLRPTGRVSTTTWRVLAWHFERPSFALPGLCDYSTINGREANWATSSVVAWLESAARIFHERTGMTIAVGDLSRRFGGPLPGHRAHDRGVEADLRPIRTDGRQCTVRGTFAGSSVYHRNATRRMIRALRSASEDRLTWVVFDDPALVAEGLTTPDASHADHLHLVWCDLSARDILYRCAR